MKITTWNHFTCLGEYQWIIRSTIHLSGDHLLYKIHRIPWDTMNLKRDLFLVNEWMQSQFTWGIHRMEYASWTLPQFAWLSKMADGCIDEFNNERIRWATTFWPVWGREPWRPIMIIWQRSKEKTNLLGCKCRIVPRKASVLIAAITSAWRVNRSARSTPSWYEKSIWLIYCFVQERTLPSAPSAVINCVPLIIVKPYTEVKRVKKMFVLILWLLLIYSGPTAIHSVLEHR